MRRPSSAGSEILQILNRRLDMLAELLCTLIPAFNGGPHVLALFRVQRFAEEGLALAGAHRPGRRRWLLRRGFSTWGSLRLAATPIASARPYGVSSRRPGLARDFAILNAACYSCIETAPRFWLTDRNRVAPACRWLGTGAAAKSAEAVSSAQFGRMPTALRLARAGNIIPHCDGDAAKVDQGRKLE